VSLVKTTVQETFIDSALETRQDGSSRRRPAWPSFVGPGVPGERPPDPVLSGREKRLREHATARCLKSCFNAGS